MTTDQYASDSFVARALSLLPAAGNPAAGVGAWRWRRQPAPPQFGPEGQVHEAGDPGPGDADQPDQARGAAAAQEGDRAGPHRRSVRRAEAGADPEAGRRADHQDAAPHPGHRRRRSAEGRLLVPHRRALRREAALLFSFQARALDQKIFDAPAGRSARCRASSRATRSRSRSGCWRRSRPTSPPPSSRSTSAWTRSSSSSPTCSRR